MTDSKTYIRTIAIFVVVLLGLAMSFNRLVDPFRLFDGPEIEGYNAVKPEMDNRCRLSKAWQIYNRKPNGLALGSSRTDYGISPTHPGWSAKNAYNAALPGGGIYEVLRYFQHAQAIQPLKQIVVGLDFFMFNAHWNLSSDFDENRLLAKSDGSSNGGFKHLERLETLASIDTLLSSYNTLTSQKSLSFKEPPHQLNGQRHPTVRENYVPEAGGHRALFIDDEQAHMKRRWLVPPERKYAFEVPKTGVSSLNDHFRNLLRFAHEHDVDLRLFISPSHAFLWESMDSMGLWDEWEIWKREMVRINEEEATTAGKAPFLLWDFSGYNQYTTEEVPPEGDKDTKMRWYWEGSHYKSALGDIVLNRIFGIMAPGTESPDDFGILLDGKTVDAHLEAIRQAQKGYRQTHQSDYKRIHDFAVEELKILQSN